MNHPSLFAKEKRSYGSRKTIQGHFKALDAPHQAKRTPRFLGFILCLCLLLHGPTSWFSSSESQNRVWEKIEIDAKPAQNLVLQSTELQQTKVNLPYDFASGSSVYCNGDPVNGLDPDGRCVEKIGAAGSIIASATFGGPAGYVGVNYGTDRLGITDTSALNDQQQLQYNTQVANLTESTQAATFALAGASQPYNQIYHESPVFQQEASETINQTTTIQPYAPVNNGFFGEVEKEFLMPGQQINRYGGSGYSRFFSPVGTPEDARSLPPGTASQPLRTFNGPFQPRSATREKNRKAT